MSIDQKRSIEDAKLKRRAQRASKKQVGISSGYVMATCADAWLDGYKAALKDVRKVTENADGFEHSTSAIGAGVVTWLDGMPQ